MDASLFDAVMQDVPGAMFHVTCGRRTVVQRTTPGNPVGADLYCECCGLWIHPAYVARVVKP